MVELIGDVQAEINYLQGSIESLTAKMRKDLSQDIFTIKTLEVQKDAIELIRLKDSLSSAQARLKLFIKLEGEQ
jgi:hypothetical protein